MTWFDSLLTKIKFAILILGLSGAAAKVDPQETPKKLPPLVNPVIPKMPGVGQRFLDTLFATAGYPLVLDTLSDQEKYQYPEWLGKTQFDVGDMQGTTTVMADPRRYGHREGHPEFTANPSGVRAHELGHVLQGQTARDSAMKVGHRLGYMQALPKFMKYDAETFADRYAQAILNLRGQAPSIKDTALTNFIQRKLNPPRNDQLEEPKNPVTQY